VWYFFDFYYDYYRIFFCFCFLLAETLCFVIQEFFEVGDIIKDGGEG